MLAPDALARSVTDEVLKISADRQGSSQAGNQKKVAELIETKVAPHFEFTSMTRLAMGRNWKQATPDQHKALSQEFRTLLVRTLYHGVHPVSATRRSSIARSSSRPARPTWW